jgi:hypothetical protein
MKKHRDPRWPGWERDAIVGRSKLLTKSKPPKDEDITDTKEAWQKKSFTASLETYIWSRLVNYKDEDFANTKNPEWSGWWWEETMATDEEDYDY